MTRQRSFKRLVRTRMEKTGESYTAARAVLLAPPEETAKPVLVTTDEKIRERTGRGWEEWFDALDEWGAADRTHREIARWVAGELEIHPLAWNAQAVTMSYERARRGRVVGERVDGFAATASRTVSVPAERLYDAFMDASEMEVRTATRPRSARFNWGDGRVAVMFDEPKPGKSRATVEHSRLADAAEAERMKAWWREHLIALKKRLETGDA